ncbi:IclR family transcriptional regulator [Roseomonas sp. HJA6]|uniref:IclR family transcriptional regulator n=1 Tax=Roseomonas alba TaxID=2846776 RepID=A0ABS7AH26_9PROT|nr:IclR family transcriptional regulator [Neoroseomonas alba]MBW6401622.1 IclR family transcriptional regulator [Neoroseomonas alba]
MDKTLLKGLSVLEAIAEAQGELRVIDDLAARVGLSRSNAHRTLQTLIHAGYVERDTVQGSYRATLKMFALGLKQLNRLDVRRLAPPFMACLARATGETIHLSVLDQLEVVYVDKIDSEHAVRAYTVVGGRAPAHAVATGKALLATESAARLDRLPAQLPGFTAATITDPMQLREELSKARDIGYAVNRGEWREDVGGVAAPVFDGLERPVAALGISGPLNRLTAERMAALAPRVVQAARRLSAALGYTRNSAAG